MVFIQNSHVVEVRHEDDGTTGGREVLIDNYGRRWIKSNWYYDTSPTSVMVGQLDQYGRIWT